MRTGEPCADRRCKVSIRAEAKKSADKADKLNAKIRRNVHLVLTLAKNYISYKALLMNNFHSDKNGAEVVAASDLNLVRVAFCF